MHSKQADGKKKQAWQHAARPLFFDCALISRILFAGQASASAIYLGRSSRTGSICLPPALLLFTAVTGRAARPPEERTVYMAFQPARFIFAAGYPGSACALTARFHPYLLVLAVSFL